MSEATERVSGEALLAASVRFGRELRAAGLPISPVPPPYWTETANVSETVAPAAPPRAGSIVAARRTSKPQRALRIRPILSSAARTRNWRNECKNQAQSLSTSCSTSRGRATWSSSRGPATTVP